MNDQPPLLKTQQLSKCYGQGKARVQVLTDINLCVLPGESIAIVGASGAGKSTLLHLLGALDTPSSGQLEIAGQNPFPLDEAARGQLRNRTLGFVYQFHHLLAEFSALDNVAMPLFIARMPAQQARQQAAQMLHQVGLGHRLQHKPSELSGGERQRTAIARALVHQPLCLLADEPTGNLDRHNASSVFELMLDLKQKMGAALVIVTHDQRFAAQTDRVLSLIDGRLQQTQ